ncbi:hypothetical protein GCM10009544_29280 [Streptomyces stramineus]|uniref:Uncharacterized protein n=1 Tax=Streptomyces stramineus TaxID=173861 RepID=A0ABP3JZ04_9ACTN
MAMGPCGGRGGAGGGVGGSGGPTGYCIRWHSVSYGRLARGEEVSPTPPLPVTGGSAPGPGAGQADFSLSGA